MYLGDIIKPTNLSPTILALNASKSFKLLFENSTAFFKPLLIPLSVIS